MKISMRGCTTKADVIARARAVVDQYWDDRLREIESAALAPSDEGFIDVDDLDAAIADAVREKDQSLAEFLTQVDELLASVRGDA